MQSMALSVLFMMLSSLFQIRFPGKRRRGMRRFCLPLPFLVICVYNSVTLLCPLLFPANVASFVLLRSCVRLFMVRTAFSAVEPPQQAKARRLPGKSD
jgi:hypothetical protein